MTPPNDQLRTQVLELLERLHRHKDAAYGDAWRKRGEVIAIFANMARKYDRLVVAFDEERPASTEPLGDTIADLCVYAAKYLTWIAEQHPNDFAAAGLPLSASHASDERGPDALQAVLHAAAVTPTDPPDNAGDAWHGIRQTFDVLERGLMAQAAPESTSKDVLSYSEKSKLAWKLVQDCAWLLTHLCAESPETLDSLRGEVAKMDRAAESS